MHAIKEVPLMQLNILVIILCPDVLVLIDTFSVKQFTDKCHTLLKDLKNFKVVMSYKKAKRAMQKIKNNKKKNTTMQT